MSGRCRGRGVGGLWEGGKDVKSWENYRCLE
jgi:hypothetical protein